MYPPICPERNHLERTLLFNFKRWLSLNFHSMSNQGGQTRRTRMKSCIYLLFVVQYFSLIYIPEIPTSQLDPEMDVAMQEFFDHGDGCVEDGSWCLGEGNTLEVMVVDQWRNVQEGFTFKLVRTLKGERATFFYHKLQNLERPTRWRV